MNEQQDYTRVSEVMNADIETISGLATVAEAIERMRARGHDSLIVERRDESDEYGLVTVQQIARQVIEKNLSAERVSVYQIMSKPVLSVRSDMNIRYAIRLLDQLGRQRALVMEQNRPAGIVTMYDMVIHYMA